LIRAFRNLFPRIPEICTGGRNESYVVVEDPRHFADSARHHDELLYTALLPAAQFRAVLRSDVAVARMAYENPEVRAVLIRKNQGRESGASQPHLHNQVIGTDTSFPPVDQERAALEQDPDVWQEILSFAADEGFLVGERDGCFLYFCPWGIFPRSYEIVCPAISGRITEMPAAIIDTFADLLHQALQILGPCPSITRCTTDPACRCTPTSAPDIFCIRTSAERSICRASSPRICRRERPLNLRSPLGRAIDKATPLA
jgi:galactose-1-phosphate uridylyltransferase